MEQTDVTEGTLKYRGAQRATYKSRVSLTCIHAYTHNRTSTTTPFCMWAMTWRQLQQLMPQKADVHRGGTFRQGTCENM